MNIAFIGGYSEKSTGGVAVSAYITAKELVNQGHQVFFYSNDPGESDSLSIDENGIKIRKFRFKNLFRASSTFKYHIKNNIDKIDIFHLHSVFIPYNYAAAKTLKKYNSIYIISPRGGYNINIFKKNVIKKIAYYILFERAIVKNASGIHCLAPGEANDIRKLGYKGLVDVIPNPVYSNLNRQDTRKNSKHNLTFLGRFEIIAKGLDKLFEIQKHIEAKEKNIYLNLYGKGAGKKSLMALKNKLGLQNVSINEPVYGLEKERIYQETSIYIQNSRWEAFGRSIADAMLRKVPVALSKKCYLAPMLEEKNAAIILDEDPKKAAEQIIRYLKDPDTLERISCNALLIAENDFNPTTVIKKLTDFYQKVIQNRRR